MALHEAHDDLAGHAGVFAGNGHTAEQPGVLRVLDHEFGHPLPQQQKRLVAPLVFGDDEGTAHLQGRSQFPQKALAVVEQGGGVQPGRTVVLEKYLVGQAEPVGPGHLALGVVPEHQVAVGVVELVDIHGLARALAHLAEGLLAPDADLAQDAGDTEGVGMKHGEVS